MAKKQSKKTSAKQSKKTTAAGKSTRPGNARSASARAAKKASPKASSKSTATSKKKTTKTVKAVKTSKTTKKSKSTRNPTTKAQARPVAGKAASASRNGSVKRAATMSVNGNGHRKPTIAAPDNLVVDAPHYEQLTAAELRKVKTGLTRKHLVHYRDLLLEKRAEIMGDVMGMEEARRSSAGGAGSHMPLHMADVGSDNYEQEFNLGLMESDQRLLREIDDALLRIQNGTYGVCIDSGQVIPKARLEIKPWAKYCIAVAMQRERRGLTVG